MRNSRLGLLLATSFSLLSYNSAPGLCQTHQVDAAAKQRHASTPSSTAITSAPMSGEHVLLFFSSKDKDDKPGASHAPAAALTIHPVLPLVSNTAIAQVPVKRPTLVAMNGDIEGSLFDAAAKTQSTSTTTTTSATTATSQPVASDPPMPPNSTTYKYTDEEQQGTASISDTLTAEPYTPEPTPIPGSPHETQAFTPAPISSDDTAAAPQTTVHETMEAAAQPRPIAPVTAPAPQAVAEKQLELTPPELKASQAPSIADRLIPDEPQMSSPQLEGPQPLPIADKPAVTQPAQTTSAPAPTSTATASSAPAAPVPKLKALEPKLSTATPEQKPTIEPIAKADARPPAPIFMGNNDSDAEKSAPVPIASLPPIKRHTIEGKSLKQPAPEQLIAQNTVTAASPIPPVVSGTIDLEEFKSSNVIDLKVSQSRTFRLRNRIIRTSISDPSIAEPVVVSENQMVLLGKSPGGATLVVWDDAGNSLAVDVRVERDFSELQATLREIDPRIIVKPFSVGGSDRVILLGDVDHAESVIRAFSAANAFMDDRGMKIMAANSRLINEKLGEMPVNMMTAMQGMTGGGGGGALGTLSQVNNFMYFSNLSNNVAKAQSIISDGGRVTSLVRVRKTPLIVLHCQFLEMNSAAVRELGIQLGMNLTANGIAFGIGGQTGQQSGSSGIGNIISNPGISGLSPSNFNAFSGQSPTYISTGGLLAGATQPFLSGVNNGLYAGLNPQMNGLGAATGPANFLVANSVPTVYNGQLVNMPVSQLGLGALNGPAALLSQTNLFGLPGGATFNSNSLANLITGTSNLLTNSHYRFSLNPTINGIISHSRARVLAEPTLVTISGERAAFLAGGEIPIEQSIATAGTAQQSVTFEPFGLRLNMIPVLLENGVINLEVSPEERLLSQANAINLINIGTIPGFTTRKLQTIVELKPGQELFISGLVSANSGRELDKTPILGEVPVLGALYRSKAFAKNESELVISVRPEIIVPGNPGQLKLPEEVSRSESVRDTNIFQVEPTILDERYMTSGQAEHPQRLPGTLAPNSPIPDNQQ